MRTRTMAAAPAMAMMVIGSSASAFSGVATITTSATISTIAIRRNGAVLIMARIIRTDPPKPRIWRKGRRPSRAAAGGSGQQRAAVQVVHGGQHPVQVRPPDERGEPEGLLPDRDEQGADHGPAVVELQLLAAVVPDAAGAESGLIPVEQRGFEAGAPLRIPVHRHHVRDVASAAAHPPARPVDEADSARAAVSR